MSKLTRNKKHLNTVEAYALCFCAMSSCMCTCSCIGCGCIPGYAVQGGMDGVSSNVSTSSHAGLAGQTQFSEVNGN